MGIILRIPRIRFALPVRPVFLAVRLSLYMGRDGAAVAEVRTRSLAALPRARQCATVQTGRPCRTL